MPLLQGTPTACSVQLACMSGWKNWRDGRWQLGYSVYDFTALWRWQVNWGMQADEMPLSGRAGKHIYDVGTMGNGALARAFTMEYPAQQAASVPGDAG